MQRGHKLLNFKICALILIIFITGVNTFPMIKFNWSDEAYESPTTPLLRSSANSMKSIIIEGAAYMLAGRSDYLLFLNKIELSELKGLDYTELKTIFDRSISNMEQAAARYKSLYKIAIITPYNKTIIRKLKTFDYDRFEKEKKPTPTIFKEVSRTLSSGNIDSLYYRMWSGTQNIYKNLLSIKNSIEKETFPNLSNLWQINRDFAELSLFGQFAAEVFYSILQPSINFANE